MEKIHDVPHLTELIDLLSTTSVTEISGKLSNTCFHNPVMHINVILICMISSPLCFGIFNFKNFKKIGSFFQRPLDMANDYRLIL